MNKYTEEELQRANNTDLVYFLQSRGEKLQRCGSEHKLIYSDGIGTHDSIMIRGNKWFDHKNQDGGGAIKFMRTYYNLDFLEAVESLIGSPREINFTGNSDYKLQEEQKEFILPERHSDNKRVFAYLSRERLIAPQIINHFIKTGKLFEDKGYHNAVFVGYDENDIPVQAHKRSTLTFGKSFRQTVGGSDTRYSFNHMGSSNKIFCFEAPIDMLSFLTLYQQNWKDHSYICLNGVYPNAIVYALETNPQLQEINLCLDNDEGGIDGFYRLKDILHEKGYSEINHIKPTMKDWNEDLKAQHGLPSIRASPHMRMELYHNQINSLLPVKINLNNISGQIKTTYQTGEPQILARTALSFSATFAEKIQKQSGKTFETNVETPDCFSVLKAHLVNQYKPYQDKAGLKNKQENLRNAVSQTLNHLRIQHAMTTTEMREMSKELCNLCDTAVRLETEHQLIQSTQTQAEPVEEPELQSMMIT